MATAGAVVDYHESIYTEMDTQAARRNQADRVLALEVVKLKQQMSDMQGALDKLAETMIRAMNLIRYQGEEVMEVDRLLTETVARVAKTEEALNWDAHDGRTMYGEQDAPTMPLADAAA